MRKAICLLVLAFLVVTATFGQDDWFLDKPIEEIRFVGLSNVAETDLLATIEPFIGKKLKSSLIVDLQAKLFALDFFEEFEPVAVPANDERSAVILEFRVVERPVVEQIEISGNQFIRRQEILDEILVKIGDLGTTIRVRGDANIIRELYLERGFPDVEVTGGIERISDTAAKAVFEIEEGLQRKVSEIRFSGISFASPSALKRIMSSKAQSLFNTGVFQESKVIEDIDAIHQYYHNRGYIDAKVVDVVREIEETERKSNLILTYYIEEGAQYTYGGMEFEGNSLYTDERLLSATRQRVGAVLSKTKLETDYLRITNVYATDGYIFNSIVREELRDEENRSIVYLLSIVERPRAHIEHIILNGNDKTTDEVILRELPFEPGDIFSQTHLIQGYQNLSNLQYFSTVLPSWSPGSADGLIDVIFDLEEGRTTDINFGVTFSGAEEGFPLIGFLKWTDTNFLGRGQEFSVGAEIATFSQSINFGFKEGWLFGQRWSGGVDLSAEHALTSDIQQDILAPIFSSNDANKVPDPYTGSYVWATGNSQERPEGTPFDGTAEELEAILGSGDAGDLVTDYAYAVSKGTGIDSGYLMDYDSFNISLGGSTGYTFILPEGRLGLGTRLSTTLSYVDYNRALVRPYDATIRANWHRLLPITTWLFNVTWDTRDIVYSPSKGFFLRESVNLAGGFLPSTRDYVKSSSKAQAFFTLFDLPVFDEWNFKGVLALNASISFVFDHFLNIDDPDDTAPFFNATSQDLLYIDGMTIARGWNNPKVYDGRALWDNWIELRIPILEQYLWFDLFGYGTGIWTELSSFTSMGIEDYRFGFGGGVRLTVPGLPIGLYLAKRFKFDATGQLAWQGGNIFASEEYPSAGLDLVIAFTAEVF